MKKFLLIVATMFLLNACSQQNIDPVDNSVSKPPKTNCGGIECAGNT